MAQPAIKPLTAIIGLVVLAAGIVATVAMLRSDSYGERQTVEPIEPIDETLIGYQQTLEIDVGRAPALLDEPRALAVSGDGTIFVAGDQSVVAYSQEGSLAAVRFTCDGTPRCLAVASDDDGRATRLFAGVGDHVEVFDGALGTRVARWERPAEGSYFTAIAVGDEDVVVADSTKRIVWRFDTEGKLLGKIGQRDAARNIPGFVITNRDHFDLTLGPDGLVYVVNPRLLRIEAYTMNGDLRSHWGRGSTQLDGFCGCCNPTDIAALSDGRFVTAEKGVVRVKLYSGAGKLQTVVAGPQHFRDTPADLAVDARGRVLVLDGKRKSVRVFEAKGEVARSQ